MTAIWEDLERIDRSEPVAGVVHRIGQYAPTLIFTTNKDSETLSMYKILNKHNTSL